MQSDHNVKQINYNKALMNTEIQTFNHKENYTGATVTISKLAFTYRVLGKWIQIFNKVTDKRVDITGTQHLRQLIVHSNFL